MRERWGRRWGSRERDKERQRVNCRERQKQAKQRGNKEIKEMREERKFQRKIEWREVQGVGGEMNSPEGRKENRQRSKCQKEKYAKQVVRG